MKHIRLIAALGTLVALCTAADSARAQQPNPWSWRGNVASGRTLEVRGVMGSVRAERASGREVEVTARKTADYSDVDEVRIEVVQDGGDVTICAVYPGYDNSCEPGGGHTRIRRRNDVHVEFVVRVPPGVHFVGAMVSGDVSATGLDGRVDLNSVSGDVTGTGLAGRADLNSVSGDVELETASGEATGRSVSGRVHATVRGTAQTPLRFSSVSGDVTLSLPRDLGANFELRTVSGDLSSDFPITLDGRISRRRMEGRIGGGGRLLEVTTVSGSIRIRSLP